MFKFVTLLVVTLFSQFAQPAIAQAAEVPKLSRYFSEKIGQVQSVMLNQEPSAADRSDGILMTDFNIDFTAQVSFGLSDVLKLTLSTELDFVFAPAE